MGTSGRQCYGERGWVGLTLRLALAAFSAVWPSVVRAQTASSATAPREEYRLANGLRVILVPDRVAQGVAVVVRYEVGSAHDPRDYRGLSHLLEHATFRGSRHLRPLEGDALLGRLGAGYNAFTSLEDTTYFTQVRTPGLESVLWLESERMGFALGGIDQAALEIEQRIVTNELLERSGGLSAPVNRAWLEALYGPKHPFAAPEDEVGDVQAVTLPGLQWFFQGSYRPDNATLVLTGNFESVPARALVARYFDSIKNPRLARRSLKAPPPSLCGARRLGISHRYLFGRYLRVAWPLPGATSASSRPRLRALRFLLAGSLNDALMDHGADAAGVDVSLSYHATHSILTVEVELHDGGNWQAVEETVLREARALASESISATELRVLRARLISDGIIAREDGVERAFSFAAGMDPDAELKATARLSSSQVRQDAQPLTGAFVSMRVEPAPNQVALIEVHDEGSPCH